MTGQEILDYILAVFKRTDKNTTVLQALSETIMDMKISFTPEDFKIIAYTSGVDALGEYYYELPDDFGYIIGDVKILDGSDSYPMKKISKQLYDQLQANPAFANVVKSKPQSYCIYGNQVYLYPIPDSLDYVYEMNYTQEEATDVTVATDPVDFSDRYRECLKYGTLARMYIDLELDSEAMKYQQLYMAQLSKIAGREDKNIDSVSFVKYKDL